MTNISVSSNSALAAALKSAASGDRITLSSGHYDLIVNNSSKSLTITSSGGAIFDSVTVQRSSNITIDNVDFNGADGAANAFSVSGSENIAIRNGDMEGVASGTGLGRGLKVTHSTDVEIANMTIHGFDVGAYLSDNDGLVLRANTLTNIGTDGFAGGDLHNTVFSGNSISLAAPSGRLHSDGIQLWNVPTDDATTDLLIENNLIQTHNSASHGIYMWNLNANDGGGPSTYFQNVTIQGNTILSGDGFGLSWGQTNHLDIHGNIILKDLGLMSVPGTPSIRVNTNATNVSVTGNVTHKEPLATDANWFTVSHSSADWTIAGNPIVPLGTSLAQAQAVLGPANVAPTIVSNGGAASATVSVAENSTSVTTVVATDPDAGNVLSYSIIGGSDAARFSIGASAGGLAFKAAPDFEAPADANGDNVYNVTVQVSDGQGGIDTQAIAVTVTDVVENTAPVITTPATASVAENTTAVIDIATTDDADREGAGLRYAITGGPDAALFGLNAATGALAFLAAPDFEAPADAGSNNVYNVQVTVTDSGGLSAVQNLAVTVTDVADGSPPVLSGDLSVTVARGGSVALTIDDLAASDVQSGASDLTFGVSKTVNGYVALQGALGTAIVNFSQAQLAAGSVFFVHNGAGTAAGSFQTTVTDGDGGSAGPVTVSATVTSSNQAPTGQPTISDTSPTEGQVLTAATDGIHDADGIGSGFSYQWQSLVGSVWTDIAGARAASFTPAQAQVDRQLHVLTSYTDGGGTVETVTSAPTIVVGDLYRSDSGSQTFTGTAGDDDAATGAGNDTLNGGEGQDTLSGMTGDDTIKGGVGDDDLTGGLGNDTVLGATGNDTIHYVVGDGGDTMNGGADVDTLLILGTAGSDTLAVDFNGTSITQVGGSGSVTNVESVVADLLGGTDTLEYTDTTAAVTVNLLASTASGFTSLAGVENVTGGSGDDSITGSSAANRLEGGSGNDTFSYTIGGGADVIDGGAGNGDVLNIAGTGGADTLHVLLSGSSLTVFEDGTLTGVEAVNASLGAGTDTLSYARSATAATVNLASGSASGFASTAGIENVTGGAAGDTLVGSTSSVNILNGNAGNDTIQGAGGGDILIGGAGADTVVTGGLNDNLSNFVRFTAAADFGDTVTNFDTDGTTTDDLVQFSGTLNTAFDDGNNNDNFLFAVGNGVAGAVNAAVGQGNGDIEALLLTGAGGEGVTNANLGNASLVSAAFNTHFNITASNGEDALLVVNDTNGNDFSVWQWVQAGGGETSANELTLVGLFGGNAPATVDNFDFA